MGRAWPLGVGRGVGCDVDGATQLVVCFVRHALGYKCAYRVHKMYYLGISTMIVQMCFLAVRRVFAVELEWAHLTAWIVVAG